MFRYCLSVAWDNVSFVHGKRNYYPLARRPRPDKSIRKGDLFAVCPAPHVDVFPDFAVSARAPRIARVNAIRRTLRCAKTYDPCNVVVGRENIVKATKKHDRRATDSGRK